MKAKELAGYLLEHPERDVKFFFIQEPDEIMDRMGRIFIVTDIGDQERDTEGNTALALIGEEVET